MCALFGFLDYGHCIPLFVLQKLLQSLANESEIRGDHASGITYNRPHDLTIFKRPKPAHKMKFRIPNGASVVMGHTRFTTQGSQKQNFNNHPFRGHAGTDFALAHNGVLYNDHELRIMENLPLTEIETDSYIAVQLLEKQGGLEFENLRYMAEKVCGGFTFTILDRENTLYFIKGESPLYLLHFPAIGLFVYASTKQIMTDALAKTALCFMQNCEVVDVDDGEIVKITKEGIITRDSFRMQEPYLPRAVWYPSRFRSFNEEDAFAELLEICGYYGVTEDEINYLRECGFTYDEIEEYLLDPSMIWGDLAEVEI